MSSKPSKQLGSLLSRVPPATAAGQTAPAPRAVPYASAPASSAPDPTPEPAAAAVLPPPVPASDREVPLQVLIPDHVRTQLDKKRADTRKSIRQLVLESLRASGFDISDEDIAGKRGRKKS